MGTTSAKGQVPYSGLRAYIGGKELELDSEIPFSDFPMVTGTAKDDENEFEAPDVDHSSHGGVAKSFAHSPAMKQEPPTLAKTNFVAPSSFYGTAAKKPKPAGPL